MASSAAGALGWVSKGQDFLAAGHGNPGTGRGGQRP
jgi:hypothetical protein